MSSPDNKSGHVEASYSLDQSLDLLADTYNYNHWIYSLCRPFLGDSICEIGAGIGNLTRFFLSADRVVAVEPETKYTDALHALAARHLNLDVQHAALADYAAAPVAACDSVLCVNVLEHIEDDAEAVGSLGRCVKPGGNVILYVPASPWSFGRLDEKLGHFRRYNKKMIRRLARQCGMRIDALRYVNFIGALGWCWRSRILKTEVIDHADARFVDRLVPYLSAMERIVPPLFGQSLFVVLKT